MCINLVLGAFLIDLFPINLYVCIYALFFFHVVIDQFHFDVGFGNNILGRLPFDCGPIMDVIVGPTCTVGEAFPVPMHHKDNSPCNFPPFFSFLFS